MLGTFQQRVCLFDSLLKTLFLELKKINIQNDVLLKNPIMI